ncbi:2078_t:CDS:2 [Paraglomus brasilianum]|uniref:2078_t:CDS:1 n=1 Tax=Paraglomus brasilianum TaxID=144538 RepID=A0A9N8W0T6_9GLOM|nr:2078_t:CDS:2 [Paraglomus brasilianum]
MENEIGVKSIVAKIIIEAMAAVPNIVAKNPPNSYAAEDSQRQLELEMELESILSDSEDDSSR